ncbi:MAG: FmdE family protein [Anaerolineales bacterium]
MTDLQALLELSASRHTHLCPRQVIGVRLGLAGAAILNIGVPQKKKTLLTIVESDGCFADGVEVATGCTVGHRTLRLEDYGKIAATFIDTKLERAIRVAPQLDVRQKALYYAPDQKKRYFAQLNGYQIIPDEELFFIEEVQLATPIKEIISRAGVRVNCDICGEEIINEREILIGNQLLCKKCCGTSYYQIIEPSFSQESQSSIIKV